MHIRKIDLNLVVVFDTVMAEGNLSAAGRRLGISQPAVSHALTRLRAITGDELFVRTSHGVKPTEHALALAAPLKLAIDQIQLAFGLQQQRRTLAGTDRTFVVDFPAGFDVVLVPTLLDYAIRSGVRARFRVHSERAEALTLALRHGGTELALDLKQAARAGLKSENLYDDSFIVCARQAHPIAAHALTESTYADAGHVTLAWSRDPTGSPVDDRLAELDVVRQVEVTMPTITGCAAVVAGSDLLFTIHRRLGIPLATRFGLRVYPLPIPIAPISVFQVWHERFDNDEGHLWLRSSIKQIVNSSRSLFF